MKYENIIKAEFISRPNRFTAVCKYEGKEVKVHVKNTGRLGELLIPGSTVYLQHLPAQGRKTEYDLISVNKNGEIINIDSQAPNKVFEEGLLENHILKQIFNPKEIKREVTFFESRLDFFINNNHYIEVKGVSLKKDGICLFPDAPTQRGVKHIHSLIKAKEQGFNASIVFIIKIENALLFSPNYDTHPEFCQILKEAEKAGVNIYAFSCKIRKNSISVLKEVSIKL